MWLLFNKNRFAQHHIFLYLMYDVLQHYKVTLEHSITIKWKNWKHAKTVIFLLIFDQLAAAAKFIWKTHTHNDSTIKLLKHLIQIIAFQISQFFAHMWINKSYMQALLVCYKMTAFWLIINSADFKSILMLKLADIEVSYDNLSSKIQKIW